MSSLNNADYSGPSKGLLAIENVHDCSSVTSSQQISCGNQLQRAGAKGAGSQMHLENGALQGYGRGNAWSHMIICHKGQEMRHQGSRVDRKGMWI